MRPGGEALAFRAEECDIEYRLNQALGEPDDPPQRAHSDASPGVLGL